MKMLIVIVAILLSGCASMNNSLRSGFDGRDYWPDRIPQGQGLALGYGELTSGSVNYTSTTPGYSSRGQFTPSQVQFNGTSYLVIPNYTTGSTQAIIRATK